MPAKRNDLEDLLPTFMDGIEDPSPAEALGYGTEGVVPVDFRRAVVGRPSDNPPKPSPPEPTPAERLNAAADADD